MNHYVLMNKNTPVLSFSCERKNNVPVFQITHQMSEQLPFGFQSIESWIRQRRAPRNREYIEQLLSLYHLYDDEGYLLFTKALGLNDTFWVKRRFEPVSWETVSLFRNPFNEVVAHLAFSGDLIASNFPDASPEFSTNGRYAKCWIREDDGIYLLKRGSDKRIASNAGLEPYSEYYAGLLARELCESSVVYQLSAYHGKLVTKCRNFCDEDTGFAPIAKVLGTGHSFKEIKQFYDGIGAAEQFSEMLVLDALTFNTDRHLNNFGVLFQTDTMQIIKPAPVFDNNLSLFPFKDESFLANPEEVIKEAFSAFGIHPNELANQCITPKLRCKLKNLSDFTFPRRNDGLPESRLHLLENLIHLQIRNILDEKSFAIPIPKTTTPEISSITIEFPKHNLTKEMEAWLLETEEELSDFTIDIQTKKLSVADIHYQVTESADSLLLDIINCNFSGDLCGINLADNTTDNFFIEGAHFINTPEDFSIMGTVTIEFSIGNDIYYLTKEQEFPLEVKHEFI